MLGNRHHPDPMVFMPSCIACQSAAAAVNLKIAAQDSRVRSGDDFPANSGFSLFLANQGFDNYGGEQIAQQVQLNRPEIISHVAGVPMNANDAANSHA